LGALGSWQLNFVFCFAYFGEKKPERSLNSHDLRYRTDGRFGL
jgi:hypothetical protein